jgi:hypothetical protein
MSDMTQADRDWRTKRMWWWQTLQKLAFESGVTNSVQFDMWVSDTHGVKILRDPMGNFLGHYEIDDEMKHIVFLLKYC